MTLIQPLILALCVSAQPAAAPNQPRCGFGEIVPRQISQFAGQASDCAYTSTTINAEYDPAELFDIPVVFHVIQDTNGTGFLSAATIQDQIDVLNEDFQALAGTPGAGGVNTMIRFHLAKLDPSGTPTTGITYDTNNSWFQDNGSYWNSLAWDTNRYLNVYSNYPAGYYGYVPDWPQGGIVGQAVDRVVVWWEAVGKAPTSGWPGNMGRTLTHEVGHYFGLEHPFYGGCASASSCYTNGDLICDTNPQSNPNYGCPGSASSCGTSDAIHNYMDYTDDVCLNQFTPEQANRMRCTLQHWRPDLAVDCNTPYGQGCAGTGGFTPTLAIDGCVAASAQVTLNISGGLGGSSAFLVLGANQSAAPLGGSCTLNVSPLLPVILGPLPLSAGGPGAGSLQINAAIPPVTTAATIRVQSFVTDGGSAVGFSNTPGVTVPVQ